MTALATTALPSVVSGAVPLPSPVLLSAPSPSLPTDPTADPFNQRVGVDIKEFNRVAEDVGVKRVYSERKQREEIVKSVENAFKEAKQLPGGDVTVADRQTLNATSIWVPEYTNLKPEHIIEYVNVGKSLNRDNAPVVVTNVAKGTVVYTPNNRTSEPITAKHKEALLKLHRLAMDTLKDAPAPNRYALTEDNLVQVDLITEAFRQSKDTSVDSMHVDGGILGTVTVFVTLPPVVDGNVQPGTPLTQCAPTRAALTAAMRFLYEVDRSRKTLYTYRDLQFPIDPADAFRCFYYSEPDIAVQLVDMANPMHTLNPMPRGDLLRYVYAPERPRLGALAGEFEHVFGRTHGELAHFDDHVLGMNDMALWAALARDKLDVLVKNFGKTRHAEELALLTKKSAPCAIMATVTDGCV